MLAACRREEVDRTPVWFMRQAGRYLPGYRNIRATHSVIDICKNPAICEAVTVMPVKELGVDAAIIFADIMFPLEGMGINFTIEENTGPVISNPVRTQEDIQLLKPFDAENQMAYLLQSIKRVKEHLEESKNALVGFSGAPFTLASYIVDGQASRDFTSTKRLMFSNKDAWHSLMSKLSEMVFQYLSAQIRAGADVVQLFDSWVGTLSTRDYSEYVAPYSEKILRELKRDFPDVPTIHFGTNTFHLLEEMSHSAQSDVFSIDWRAPISEARKILGDVSIQGNLEPTVLLSNDLDGFVGKRVQRVIDDNQGERGHIFNLGHGIHRDTPVENAKYVVNYVHENT